MSIRQRLRGQFCIFFQYECALSIYWLVLVSSFLSFLQNENRTRSNVQEKKNVEYIFFSCSPVVVLSPKKDNFDSNIRERDVIRVRSEFNYFFLGDIRSGTCAKAETSGIDRAHYSPSNDVRWMFVRMGLGPGLGVGEHCATISHFTQTTGCNTGSRGFTYVNWFS